MAEAGASYFEANRAYRDAPTDDNSDRLLKAYRLYFETQNCVLRSFPQLAHRSHSLPPKTYPKRPAKLFL